MTATTSADSTYAALSQLVASRTGLSFAESRRDDTEAGIRRAMAKAGIAQPARYLELIESGAVGLDDLMGELTVGETYFFRDPAQFEFIRREILPDILRRREPGHQIRIWSAGCASGEEPYSLAILLDDAGLGGHAPVLASDISPPALARAREASYGSWSLRGVDDRVTRHHLRASAGRYVLDERIKRRVSFRHLNLALDAYPSLASGAFSMDLILCRNVLIYFDSETVKRVAGRLYFSLAPDGWLVAGASDPPLSDHAPFDTVVTPVGVYYRRGAETGRSVVLSSPDTPETIDAEASARTSESELDAVDAGGRLARTPSPDSLARAREALAAGAYDEALQMIGAPTHPEAAEIAVRARANRDGAEAATELAAHAARRHPLSPELHYLHAVLLLELGRLDESIVAIRRVLFLDGSLAIAHFVMATILHRRRELAAARRAYDAAAELAGARPPDEQLPLGDGESAGRLARAARTQSDLLGEGVR